MWKRSIIFQIQSNLTENSIMPNFIDYLGALMYTELFLVATEEYTKSLAKFIFEPEKGPIARRIEAKSSCPGSCKVSCAKETNRPNFWMWSWPRVDDQTTLILLKGQNHHSFKRPTLLYQQSEFVHQLEGRVHIFPRMPRNQALIWDTKKTSLRGRGFQTQGLREPWCQFRKSRIESLYHIGWVSSE